MNYEQALFAGVERRQVKRKPEVQGAPVVSLRDYQSDLMSAVRRSMAAGHRRVVMQGVTGLGKTRMRS